MQSFLRVKVRDLCNYHFDHSKEPIVSNWNILNFGHILSLMMSRNSVDHVIE